MVIRKAEIRLVLACPYDLPLIDRWLAQGDIRRWWGCVVPNQREMRVGMGCQSGKAHIFLILNDQREPVGFLSLLQAKLITKALHDWPPYLPLDAWEIGIVMARQSDRRKGLATKALRMAHEYVSKRSAKPVFAFILKSNEASLCTFKKLGYDRVLDKRVSTSDWAVLRYDQKD